MPNATPVLLAPVGYVRRPGHQRRFSIRASTAAFALGAALALGAPDAHAQRGMLDRLSKKAQDRIEQKADRAVNRALGDSTGSADSAPTSGATPSGATAGARGASAGSVIPADGAGGAAAAGFRREAVPLFVTDYANAAVGDVPRGVNVLDGNVAVALSGGQRWLRLAGEHNAFQIDLDRPLPDRFTVETEVALSAPSDLNHFRVTLGTARGVPASENMGQIELQLQRDGRVEFTGTGAARANGRTTVLWGRGRAMPLRILVAGGYVRVWAGSERVLNLARRQTQGGTAIHIFAYAREDSPAYVGPIRVMAAAPSVAEVVAQGGRAEVTALRFARGSSAVPEDAADALAGIAAALRGRPDLRLQVQAWAYEGQTATADADLSARRARAVVRALVERHDVPAARVTARGAGRGDLAPDDGNDPPPQRLVVSGG